MRWVTIHSTVQTQQNERVTHSARMYNNHLPQQSLHITSRHVFIISADDFLALTLVQGGHPTVSHGRITFHFHILWVSSCGAACLSQSRHFHNVAACWACRCLDGGGRPPLRGPVQSVTVRQCWRCWETNDGRGDSPAFAIDPAAVVTFQIEVWTTGGEKRLIH